MSRAARIGVDVGGAFTDIVLALPGGRIHVNKTTTTPADPGEGVAAGVAAVLEEARLDPREVAEVVHGTTVASNTILQKVGARTGLLTTRGFRDVFDPGPACYGRGTREPTVVTDANMDAGMTARFRCLGRRLDRPATSLR